MKRALPALFLIVGAGFLPPVATHAQDGCPQGQYQASPPGASGPGFCAPIPRDLQGRPVAPPRPATHWGAIATDANLGLIGTASNLPDKGAAERQALSHCQRHGGSECKIAIAYGNGCAALASNEKGYQAAADVTLNHARQTAMRRCTKAGGKGCHVAYSDCSPAQQISDPRSHGRSPSEKDPHQIASAGRPAGDQRRINRQGLLRTDPLLRQ